MTITLQNIWPIGNLTDYKIHFARDNKITQPLDVWVRDKQEWQGWQEYRPKKNDFNRRFILSLMQFYHETDIWLFGGVFEVLSRPEGRYEVRLDEHGKDFIGRLKIHYVHKHRVTRVRMESYYSQFQVQEILREPYSGRTFPGYDKIDLSFAELEVLIKNNRQDWKTTLESIKGIYLITDTNTNKRYVGSARGDDGIWSRWTDYVNTGHGGNKGLRELIKQDGIEYCRAHFRFTLLEQCLTKMPDDKVLERESFWKRILLTRGEQGLNRN